MSAGPLRRLVAAALSLAAAGSAWAPRLRGNPMRRTQQRFFVLGFDGMGPTLARRYIDEGKLPTWTASP